MRLLSQLGAHPSRLQPVSSRTPRSLGLPPPANSRSKAGSSIPVLLPRSRLVSFLGVIAVTFLFLFLFSGTRVVSNSERWTLRAPSFLPGKLSGSVKPEEAVNEHGSNSDALANLLPIREDPHPNPHIPLPCELAFTNPWPEDPKIAETWLSGDRLAQMGLELPDWPRQTLGSTRQLKLPNRLSNSSMVRWADFARPSGYKPGVLTEDASASSAETQRIQAATFEETEADRGIRRARREWVKKAFLHAWTGYKARAWGHDEVRPLSGSYSNAFNGWGAMIVDSLSTLLVMNLTEEYRLARTHVRQIDFTTVLGEGSAYGRREDSRTVPVFETIIRYLGGLLSAYDLTDGKDTLMLERAEELAGWLMGAFDTRYGLPVGKYAFGTSLRGKYAGKSVLSEVGSFSLEFGRLAQITGKQEYYDVIHRAGQFLAKHQWQMSGAGNNRPGSLMQAYVDDSTGNMEGPFSFGAQTDSYYEYLLKGGMLFRNSSIGSKYLSSYSSAISDALSSSLISPVGVVPGAAQSDLLMFGQLQYGTYWPILEHLACFAGGLTALGSRALPARSSDLDIGRRFTKTCAWAYNATYTGLGAESMTFYHPQDVRRFSKHTDSKTGEEYLKVLGSPAGQMKGDRKFQGRPETIESVWYLWRITGEKQYQEMGWEMFRSWVKTTVVTFGFAGVNNVNSPNYRHIDRMESFVLAETLKYYYLLFSEPGHLSLDEFVLNTEAHPLRLPSGRTLSSWTSPWAENEQDDTLAREQAEPDAENPYAIGRGTRVQQLLVQVMS